MRRKTLKKLSRAAIVGLIPSLLSGCGRGFETSENMNEDIYGGPEMYEENFDPQYNAEPCVYGGPEMYEEDISDNDVSDNDVSENDVSENDVSENEGPVKSDLTVSPRVDVSGSDYDPSENVADPIYGAPTPTETR